jgi:hypothetical protein
MFYDRFNEKESWGPMDELKNPQGPIVCWRDEIPFEIYWEPPEGINIEDPLLPEPKYEKLISEVGVQKIVDAIVVEVAGGQISVGWNGDVLGELIPEQRQVIVAHLAHILYQYLNRDASMVRDYVIKSSFHRDVQRLADLESEPGEFE